MFLEVKNNDLSWKHTLNILGFYIVICYCGILEDVLCDDFGAYIKDAFMCAVLARLDLC